MFLNKTKLLFFVLLFSLINVSAWHNDTCSKRVILKLYNPQDTTVTNFPTTDIYFEHNGDITANNTIMVYSAEGNPLNYYTRNLNSTAIEFAFITQSIPAHENKLYYVYFNCSSDSSGYTKTRYFFEDCSDGEIDDGLTITTVGGGSVACSNGILTISGSVASDDAYINSTYHFDHNVTAVSVAQIPSILNSHNTGIFWLFSDNDLAQIGHSQDSDDVDQRGYTYKKSSGGTAYWWVNSTQSWATSTANANFYPSNTYKLYYLKSTDEKYSLKIVNLIDNSLYWGNNTNNDWWIDTNKADIYDNTQKSYVWFGDKSTGKIPDLKINRTEAWETDFHLYAYDLSISTEEITTEKLINTPLDAETYNNTEVILNYTVVDDSLNYINTWYYLDGVETYYNATNNTDVIQTLSFSSEGEHTVTVIAEKSSGNVTHTVRFYTNFFDLDGYRFDKSNYLSGEVFTFYQYVRYYDASATNWSNNLTLNGTVYPLMFLTQNSTHYIYYTSSAMPFTTTDVKLTYNTSISNSLMSETSQNKNITLNSIHFDDCSAYHNVVFNFTGIDEDTGDCVSYTLNGVFTISATIGSSQSTDYNFSFDATKCYHTVCTNSTNDTYYVNAEIEYYNDTDVTRNYYITNVLTGGTINKIDLYLLQDNSDAKLTKITTKNTLGQEVEGIITYINKFDYATNTYKTVAMTKSDALGFANTYIKAPDILYQFILLENGTVVNTYDNLRPVPDSSTDEIDIELYTSPNQAAEFWNYYDKIATSCSYDNSTNKLTCSYVDSSGLMQSVTFEVRSNNLMNDTLICSSTLTSSSGSFICDLSGNKGSAVYSIYGTFQESENLITSGVVEISSAVTYGNIDGMLSAMFIVIFAATAVIEIPEFSVIAAVLALAVAIEFNLIYLSLTSVTSLLIVAIVIASKVSKNE